MAMVYLWKMIIGVACFQAYLLMLDGFKKRRFCHPHPAIQQLWQLSKSEAKTCQRLLAAEIGYPWPQQKDPWSEKICWNNPWTKELGNNPWCYQHSSIYICIYIYIRIILYCLVCIHHLHIHRRKFRSQTYDDVARWKAKRGRGRKKGRVEKRNSEKRKSQKKEIADAHNIVFFDWFVAPKGQKTEAHFPVKKHIWDVVARSTQH